MTSPAEALAFHASLGCWTAPATDRLATRLAQIEGLDAQEADAIGAAARTALEQSLHRKLSRLLVVELNAARVEGRLSGDDGDARWRDFIATASTPAFWDGLSRHYPTLQRRIETVVANHDAAILDFARHWAADRDGLASLLDGVPGALTHLSFGAGDTHGGGRTVAIVTCAGPGDAERRIVYKPRSLAVDAALAELIAWLEREAGAALPIRVPEVLCRGDHGWAQFIPHVHAADEKECAQFYAGIGQWLALMRLLGGTDLHAENLIAHRGHPVIVDCETLFTPDVAPFPSGLGDATDRATRFVRGTVLATGLLPSRGQGLGWRGVDASGIGALPNEQPQMTVPAILGAGTDEARLGTQQVDMAATRNHPAQHPALIDHWPAVLAGFASMSELLRRADACGGLRGKLAAFEACRVRVVLRNTEIYAQIGRMLWHPVSLNDEAKARTMARDLLMRMADNISTAPGRADVVEAEIDDMLAGDIPYFSGIAGEGVLAGPGGTTWLAPRDLVEAAWCNWRAADLALEENFVRTAIVSAFVNDGGTPGGGSLWPQQARHGDLDARRRRAAAAILRRFVATAIHGDDGTATWIAPTLTATGWSVQPLDPDLYGGLSGVALLAAGYAREARAGRADPVDGVDALLMAVLRTLDAAEDKHARLMRQAEPVRPPAPGAYMGMGGQIWTRLMLAQWDAGEDSLARAAAMAADLPRTLTDEDLPDLLSGPAGAIPALLALARRTGDGAPLATARAFGDRICDRAILDDGRAHWRAPDWPQGLGGFAHGVSGVGWALFQLAEATGDPRHLHTARAAFAFEDALFDAAEGNWIDLRMLGAKSAGAWCHGAVGIGLARLDLDPDLARPATRLALRRAAAATWRLGRGWNHCACHGDSGAWELLDRAIACGEGPAGVSRADLQAAILTGIEDHGPSCGLLRDAFVPGLVGGLGGVAYQLLRFHPENDLPSFLMPGAQRVTPSGVRVPPLGKDARAHDTVAASSYGPALA